MYKTTITLTFALFAAAVLASGRAEAGGSASAASKYGPSSRVATVSQVRNAQQSRSSEFGITEFSSSSRAPSYGHAYR